MKICRKLGLISLLCNVVGSLCSAQSNSLLPLLYCHCTHRLRLIGNLTHGVNHSGVVTFYSCIDFCALGTQLRPEPATLKYG